MAAKKRRTTSKRNTRKAPVKSSAPKRSASPGPKKTADEGISDEACIFIAVIVCILLFLSDVHLLGKAGEAIRGVQFGLFGIMAYVFPIAVAVWVVLWFLYADLEGFIKKSVFGLLIFIDCCILAHLPVVKEQLAGGDNAFLFSRANSNGGGIFGGILAGLLYETTGAVGAWVIAIFFLLIIVMLLTDASVFDIVEGISAFVEKMSIESERKTLERDEIRREKRERNRIARENNRREREELEALQQEAEKKKEEERKLRSENKVRGVPMNLTVGEDEIPAAAPEAGEAEFVPAPPEGEIIMDGDIPEEEYFDDVDEEVPEEYDGEDIEEPVEEEFAEEEEEDVEILPPFTEEELCEEEFDYDSFSFTQENAVEEVSVRPMPRMASTPVTFEQSPEAEITVNTEPEEPEPKAPAQVPATAAIPSSGIFASGGERTSSSGVSFSKPVAKSGEEIRRTAPKIKWKCPSLSDNLLKKPEAEQARDDSAELERTKEALRDVLDSFGIKVEMKGASRGPTVTRYEMIPERGVKVSRILGLADDIKLALAATDVRIEAPIPGKSAVGIEVPNEKNTVVSMYELLESRQFKNFKGGVAFAVGKGLSGETVVTDITKMPHVLIAGTTGSGKSVCVNTMIMSMLYKYTPDDLKLIMIDPKVVELSIYNGIPHLLIPVVTDPKQAAAALHWGVVEMDRRYECFAEEGVRNLEGYNDKVNAGETTLGANAKPMQKIIIIVDELADLMMTAGKEVEESICRLLQKARACGIHLVIATQRPSVDVITGLIKANMPSRIAFAVGSQVDSRTILDMGGAEKLLGKGDMLFYPQGYTRPERLQGAFVSDREVGDVADFWKKQSSGDTYDEQVKIHMENAAASANAPQGSLTAQETGGDGRDEYFVEAARFILADEKASIGRLQRKLKIGFNRAARIMDQLAEAGIVGDEEGTKPRRVLMSVEKFESLLEQGEF